MEEQRTSSCSAATFAASPAPPGSAVADSRICCIALCRSETERFSECKLVCTLSKLACTQHESGETH